MAYARQLSTALVALIAAASIALPLVAADPQVVGVQAPPPAIQAVREQIVAIDSAAAGRGTTALPMMGVALTGTGLIVGQVVDAASGASVANAMVSLGASVVPPPATVVTSGRGTPATPPAPVSAAGRGPAAPATVLRQLTDGDGRFAFRQLPRGAYSIVVTRPGYVDGAYGRLRPTGNAQSLPLAEGERRSDVKIRVFKYGAITGLVREENGEAAVGVNVRAYRRMALAGRQQLTASFVVQTDDRGIYRLANLMPGEYVVAAQFASSTAPAGAGAAISAERQAALYTSGLVGTPTSPGSIVPQTDRFVVNATGQGSSGAAVDSSGTILVTPTTYFPSALVASQAQPIAIGSGEERGGVDLVLRTAPATFISGRLMGPDGPAGEWALTLVPTDVGDLSTDPQVATALTDAGGAFMFLGIPAGSYVIQTFRASPQGGPRVTTTVVNGQPVVLSMTMPDQAAQQGPVQPTLWTATPVSVGPEGLRDLAVTLRRGFAVSGRVEFDGTADRPPASRLQTITVSLEPADGRVRAPMPGTRLEATGQFTTTGFLPGKYVVRVLNPPGGWTLKSVMLGASDVSDVPLELEARDVAGLIVTFTDKTTDLQGTVRDPQGKTDDAAVVTFPIDNRLWANAGASSRRMRMTRVSATGTFAFSGLPPGEYGVVAFSEEFAGEWPDARFIEQLSRVATRVTLVDGGKQSVDLTRQTVRPGLLALEKTSGVFFGISEKHSRRLFPSGPSADEADDEAPAQQTRDTRTQPTTTPAAGATISGSVTLDDASNQPVRRARVSVRVADARFDRAVMTDDSGRFVVGSLPPGRYTITVTKPSYLAGYYGSKRPGRGPGMALALTAGQRADVSIKVARGAAVTGIIRDELGAPLPNARVTASSSRYTNGQRVPIQVASAQTDDRGMYRLFGLPPASYIITAVPPVVTNEVRQLTSDDWQVVANELRQAAAAAPATGGRAGTPAGRTVGYAPMFYPGTLFANEATPLALVAGQEATSIDLAIRLTPTARIEGMVSRADGRPVQGALLMIFPQDISTGFVSTVTPQPDGRFASPYVPPGRYTITARASSTVVEHDHPTDVIAVAPVARSVTAFQAIPPGVPPPPPPPPPPPGVNTGSRLFAEQVFDVNGENITGVSIVLQEGLTVSGRVQFEGSQALPAGPNQPTVRISMTSAIPSNISLGTASTSSQIGSPFTLNGVPPGKMRFAGQVISNVAGPGQPPGPGIAGWTLKSAVVNGRDALDLPLDMPLGQNIEGAVLTFTDRMAELSGAVMDGAGEPNPDLLIMLLPADRAYWEMPSSRRFRAPMPPGFDGRYRFFNLPAGDYLLVALGDADGIDMSDRTMLEQLAASAIKITVADGEKKVQDIKTR